MRLIVFLAEYSAPVRFDCIAESLGLSVWRGGSPQYDSSPSKRSSAEDEHFDYVRAEKWLSEVGPMTLLQAEFLPCKNLHEWLRSNETVHLVALYSDPRIALARGITEDNRETEEIADRWYADASQIISCKQSFPERTFPVESESLQDYPAIALEALCQRMGLEPQADLGSIQEPQTRSLPTDIPFALSKEVLTGRGKDISLYETLHGLSVTSHESRKVDENLNLELAVSEFRDLRRERERLLADNQYILREVHELQSQAELAFSEYEEERVKTESETERANTLAKENRHLKERVNRLSRVLDDIKRSRSWKLTVPLRWLTRVNS